MKYFDAHTHVDFVAYNDASVVIFNKDKITSHRPFKITNNII